MLPTGPGAGFNQQAFIAAQPSSFPSAPFFFAPPQYALSLPNVGATQAVPQALPQAFALNQAQPLATTSQVNQASALAQFELNQARALNQALTQQYATNLDQLSQDQLRSNAEALQVRFEEGAQKATSLLSTLSAFPVGSSERLAAWYPVSLMAIESDSLNNLQKRVVSQFTKNFFANHPNAATITQLVDAKDQIREQSLERLAVSKWQMQQAINTNQPNKNVVLSDLSGIELLQQLLANQQIDELNSQYLKAVFSVHPQSASINQVMDYDIQLSQGRQALINQMLAVANQIVGLPKQQRRALTILHYQLNSQDSRLESAQQKNNIALQRIVHANHPQAGELFKLFDEMEALVPEMDRYGLLSDQLKIQLVQQPEGQNVTGLYLLNQIMANEQEGAELLAGGIDMALKAALLVSPYVPFSMTLDGTNVEEQNSFTPMPY
ncbi:MAG: hypothetical protein R2857_12305 [Vampirovibrionales bacterium]|nr:hypothetical protein [Cyanobacteria bacterium HKST-UBA03]